MATVITMAVAVVLVIGLVGAMAVGLLRGIRIKGSCGGLSALEANQPCSICGRQTPDECRNSNTSL